MTDIVKIRLLLLFTFFGGVASAFLLMHSKGEVNISSIFAILLAIGAAGALTGVETIIERLENNQK